MNDKKNINKDIESEDDIISWEINEQISPKKSQRWYIIAGIISVLLIIYAIFTANPIFAFIVIFGIVLIIITDNTKPAKLHIELSDEGVKIGKEFYLYEQFEDFFIIYKPKEDIKKLYLEFKRFVKPQISETAKTARYEWFIWLMNFSRTRLSIPLNDMNPLFIRKNLLKYLKEDVERTNIPLSEQLSSMLKF